MKVIYNGKLIETDAKVLNGKSVITEDNYYKHDYRCAMEKWQELKEEMLILKPWTVERKKNLSGAL